MSEIGGSKLNNVLKAKEDLLKSPEELESEKKHIVAQRVGKLDLNGLSKEDLIAQVNYLLFEPKSFSKTHWFLFTNHSRRNSSTSIL